MHLLRSMLPIVLATLVFPTGTAIGFEKKAHGEISKKAVSIYRAINPGLSEKRAKALLGFIEGSKDEDNISMQRMFHWHFYDPAKKLGRTWWGAERSNGVRFEKLVKQLSESKGMSPDEYYALAGRIVHHIQDMSSPPHTVPVYHLKDPFDSYGTSRINRITLQQGRIPVLMNESRGTLKDRLPEFLKYAADKTLESIEKPVVHQGKIIADNWSLFWLKAQQTGERCRKKPCKGFGCYGKMVFGFTKGPFIQEVYQDFYDHQIENAVADTVKVLLLLGNVEI